MFASGTFGAVIGDFCSHNTGLDDAGASILLSPIMAVLFARAAVGATLAAVFLAGRCFDQRRQNGGGDFISGRDMLGLPVSAAVTAALFIAVLVIWTEQSSPERGIAIAS